MNSIIRQESAVDLFGLRARAFNVVAADSGRILNQKIGTSKEYTAGGRKYRITAELRFDDQCGNGHEDFSITGTIREYDRGAWREHSGGCIHEDIANRFPQLAHLIKWHLTGIAGPMHYEANTAYLAGDRDCHGLRAGEVRQIRNGRTGELCWELVARNAPGVRISGTPTGDKFRDGETVPLFILEKHAQGDAPGAVPVLEWAPWNRVGEGKARQLDAARSAAVWPDATDTELMQEPEALRAALRARLPALLEAFKADMLACGFLWPTLPARK